MFVSRKRATVCVTGVVMGLLSTGCATKTYVVVPSNPPSSTTAVAAAATPPSVDLLNGVYRTMVGSVEAQWTIASTCSAGCTATVSSSNGGWTGNATLTGNRWDLTVERPNGATCRNGTSKPTLNHYSWDAVTLTGTVDSTYECEGEPPGVYSADFTIAAPPLAESS